jgi:hypothetical protein
VLWLGRVSECLPWCFLKGENDANVRRAFGCATSDHVDTRTGARSDRYRGTLDNCNVFQSREVRQLHHEQVYERSRCKLCPRHNGLLLLLDSAKWKLERGKAYTVVLVAGSRSVDAKALAESKGATIALTDRLLNERIHSAEILELRGEGATLRVPLDGSMAALGRLEICFEKNSRL